ncbi:hypothetical protein [Reichenbachiella ulvae]|uniref:Uncharacterized protein n=1 Tax=Reichenbachiella ulvae TaxID=2980104 RepID=A0ABT3CNA2_9BACT|nr:hypothetical protein [Reichenbachiella ulvae]MCV9385057.1 hypothetical protein [Reichenbachiella ulvae]
MDRHILFLTDGNIDILNVMKVAVARHRILEEKVGVTFLQGVYLPDSTIDLMFYSKRKVLEQIYDRDFRSACEMIRSKYSSDLSSIRKELFSIPRQIEFNRYLDQEGIDEVYYQPGVEFVKRHDRSFDLRPYANKCNRPVSAIDWDSESVTDTTLFDPLVKLFFNHESFDF